MSAFLVSKEHVDLLVAAAAKYGSRARLGYPDDHGGWTWLGLQIDAESLQKLGQILWDENRRSLRARYGGCLDADESNTIPYSLPPELAHAHGARLFLRRRAAPEAELAYLAKQIACYEYQACETDDWHRTPAYHLCQELRSWLCDALPGYESAPWGV